MNTLLIKENLMSHSLYAASVPVFRQLLDALADVLEKAEAHALERRIEPGARLAGIESPRYEDGERTFTELQQRITRTVGFLDTLEQADIDAGATRPITHGSGERARHFDNGAVYLTHFAMPQFCFHVTTAYAILRHNGVPIGKRDFIGSY
jgi:hypothetical protein